jgi:hypothetical protein
LQEKLEETKKASRAEIHRLLMKVGGRWPLFQAWRRHKPSYRSPVLN